MEQIQHSTTYSRAAAYIPSLRLLPYLRFSLILLSGFTLILIGARVFAQSTVPALPPPNPFLEYADIFPGQPQSAADERGFLCGGNNYNYYPTSDVTCVLTLTSGDFDAVDVNSSDGIIRKVTFTLRENTLKVGNLVLLLGDPDFRTYPRKVFFYWNNYFVIVSTTVNGNHPAMRPVWNVTFTDTY